MKAVTRVEAVDKSSLPAEFFQHPRGALSLNWIDQSLTSFELSNEIEFRQLIPTSFWDLQRCLASREDFVLCKPERVSTFRNSAMPVESDTKHFVCIGRSAFKWKDGHQQWIACSLSWRRYICSKVLTFFGSCFILSSTTQFDDSRLSKEGNLTILPYKSAIERKR